VTEYEWRLFTCCDCEDESDPFRVIHPVPVGSHPERGCDIDWCPRCGGHHSLIGYGETVTVTNRFGRQQ
jgi:hypothetical protein